MCGVLKWKMYIKSIKQNRSYFFFRFLLGICQQSNEFEATNEQNQYSFEFHESPHAVDILVDIHPRRKI